MKGELDELVENAISHSSIPHDVEHTPVLVTTGFINEAAVERIRTKNITWKRNGYPPLETWSGSMLLKLFIDHSGRFLPIPIDDFHRFLELMICNGRGYLDKDEFALLLESVLPIKKKGKDVHRNSYPVALPIIVEYALASYDRCGNQFAKIEAYVLLWSYLRAYGVKARIRKDIVGSTLTLIERSIHESVAVLYEECIDEYGESTSIPPDPFYDEVAGPYRSLLLAGLFSAIWLSNQLGFNCRFLELRQSELRALIYEIWQRTSRVIPSESYIPACFLISLFLKRNGFIRQYNRYFPFLIQYSSYLKTHEHPRGHLREPYFSFEASLYLHYGIPTGEAAKIDTDISSNSYTLWPLILIACRQLNRQLLNRTWPEVSKLHFSQLKPEKDYQRLLWRNKNGKLVQHIVELPTSWAKLHREATSQTIPRIFAGREYFIPMFLFSYPHRFDKELVLGLDELISNY